MTQTAEDDKQNELEKEHEKLGIQCFIDNNQRVPLDYVWDDKVLERTARCECEYEDINARVVTMNIPGKIHSEENMEERHSFLRMIVATRTYNMYLMRRMHIIGCNIEDNLLYFWVGPEPRMDGELSRTYEIGVPIALEHIYKEPDIYEPEKPEQEDTE